MCRKPGGVWYWFEDLQVHCSISIVYTYTSNPSSRSAKSNYQSIYYIYTHYTVMWILIDRMRIRSHKIIWMRIRIQDNKITKLMSNHLLKVNKKYIFSNLYRNHRDLLLFNCRNLRNHVSSFLLLWFTKIIGQVFTLS